MNIQKVRTEYHRDNLKVHKLPRIGLPHDRSLHAENKHQHVDDPMPRIDYIVIDVNVSGMDPRSYPIKKDPI